MSQNKKHRKSMEALRLGFSMIGGALIVKGYYEHNAAEGVVGTLMVTCSFMWHHFAHK